MSDVCGMNRAGRDWNHDGNVCLTTHPPLALRQIIRQKQSSERGPRACQALLNALRRQVFWPRGNLVTQIETKKNGPIEEGVSAGVT